MLAAPVLLRCLAIYRRRPSPPLPRLGADAPLPYRSTKPPPILPGRMPYSHGSLRFEAAALLTVDGKEGSRRQLQAGRTWGDGRELAQEEGRARTCTASPQAVGCHVRSWTLPSSMAHGLPCASAWTPALAGVDYHECRRGHPRVARLDSNVRLPCRGARHSTAHRRRVHHAPPVKSTSSNRDGHTGAMSLMHPRKLVEAWMCLSAKHR